MLLIPSFISTESLIQPLTNSVAIISGSEAVPDVDLIITQEIIIISLVSLFAIYCLYKLFKKN